MRLAIVLMIVLSCQEELTICRAPALFSRLLIIIPFSNFFLTKFNFKKFNLNDDLYDFSGDCLIRVIKNCNDTVDELMIFGHNNAITNFVNSYGDISIDNVPTCGVTIISFEIDRWKDLKRGRTIKTLFPRDL